MFAPPFTHETSLASAVPAVSVVLTTTTTNKTRNALSLHWTSWSIGETNQEFVALLLLKRKGQEDDGLASPFASTFFLNYNHMMNHDPDLTKAIEFEMVPFNPFLRKAVESFVLDRQPELDSPCRLGTLTCFSSPFAMFLINFPFENDAPICIGHLTALSGTVTTLSSEVRPASFRCNKCMLLAENIQQQYRLALPSRRLLCWLQARSSLVCSFLT